MTTVLTLRIKVTQMHSCVTKEAENLSPHKCLNMDVVMVDIGGST